MIKKRKNSLYRQIIFTLLAFAIMVFLSYAFNSRTVRENMSKNAENVLSFTHEQIDSELNSYKILLESFSQTAAQMISDGNIDQLQQYVNAASDYAASPRSGLKSVNGLYGYFENIFDEGVFLSSAGWVSPDDFHPAQGMWYTNAVKNCGEISETAPYINEHFTGGYFITYSRCVHNNDGVLAGVVGTDVPLEKIGDISINAALSEGGYGLLAAADLTVLSYANEEFIGRRMNEPGLAFSEFSDAILKGHPLYEQPLKNWKGEDVITFSRILPNGWHLVLLCPRDMYYQGTTQMLIVLLALGALMAGALILVLVNIDKARRKAGEESRQKSAFLANMSHEIRTPMNAIIGMTYIGKSAGDIPRKDYCLDKIENASQHLLGVINDVLDMSKIEANMFELSPVEFNFEKTLQRVISIVGFRAEEKKQKISVHIDKSIPRSLVGDDQRLAQVVTNLFGNAVKFTPEGGSIKLDTRYIGEENGLCTLRVTVKDSGIGISEKEQKQLFRSFQQADSTTSRRFGGSGLGLAISKNIIEMMGGRIELESVPGKGSSFSFTFIVKRGAKKTAKLSEAGINWKNISVMAIDDDREILDYFIEIMQGLGASCDVAQSGAEALTHIEKNGMHHIYFIDWKMPDMDGLKLAQELKSRSEFPDDAVIIMISAAEWSAIADEAKKVGFEKFLSKPLFPSAIADAIAEAIGGTLHSEDELQVDYSGIFEGYKILLVEDIEINREIIGTLVEPTLLKMDCAENGLEAVAMFEKSPDDYDLILMDVQMPEMDGYQATRIIRDFGSKNAKTVPIIAMTANVFREDIDNCLKAGMDDHLGKPVDVEEFYSIMKKYLKRK